MLLGLVGALAVAVPMLRADAEPPTTTSPEAPACGSGDRPEPGLQGAVPLEDQLSGRSRDGYSCNLRWVGGTRLAGGGDTQMTWYGTCAYRVESAGGAASDGVAVIDVTDPSQPRPGVVLREPQWAGQGGVLNVHEGIHASERSGLLVVPAGRYLSTYDVSHDCRRPQLLSTFDVGQGADLLSQLGLNSGFHSGQLSPDGTFFYGTTTGFEGFIAPFGPCLTVVDLLDPRQPQVVTRWGGALPCHDLGFDPSGDRAFVGAYGSLVGHPAAVVGAFTPLGLPSQLLTGMAVLDTSQVRARVPGAQLQQIGGIRGGNQHTETYARIGGRDYVLGAEEATCPNGNVRVVDVTRESQPRDVGRLSLGVNRIEGCLATFTEPDRASNLLLYTSHYVSVDDPEDATLAFVSWYASGLRVFDIRDPARPVEIAYFNPPVGTAGEQLHDSTTTYPRYVPETGQIWVGSGINAFWVVELDPHLRPEALRGAAPAPWSANATTEGPAPAFLQTRVTAPTTAPLYCLIGVGSTSGAASP
jgi:hypothetical protein